MKKTLLIMLMAMATLSSACMASRKFVRNEVKTSSDALNAKIENNEGDINELRDGVDRVNGRVAGVDGKVSELDTRTSSRLETLNGDVQNVNQKASQAQASADRLSGAVDLLDQKFAGRNNFSVSSEKAIQFRFNSAQLDAEDRTILDEAALMLLQNPDALIVLEGRTDSTGDAEYNIKLGERRVEAVKRYLAVDKAVPVYRIHNISFGSARPIASNDSRSGREQNRAVIMTILVPRTDPSMVSQ